MKKHYFPSSWRQLLLLHFADGYTGILVDNGSQMIYYLF